LAQIDVLLYLVETEPGRSAVELAQAIYGEGATELRVQQDLVRLVSSGEIERRGLGSVTHPHTYYPIPSRRRD
jgi:predicted transcriptional regulator